MPGALPNMGLAFCHVNLVAFEVSFEMKSFKHHWFNQGLVVC